MSFKEWYNETPMFHDTLADMEPTHNHMHGNIRGHTLPNTDNQKQHDCEQRFVRQNNAKFQRQNFKDAWYMSCKDRWTDHQKQKKQKNKKCSIQAVFFLRMRRYERRKNEEGSKHQTKQHTLQSRICLCYQESVSILLSLWTSPANTAFRNVHVWQTKRAVLGTTIIYVRQKKIKISGGRKWDV